MKQILFKGKVGIFNHAVGLGNTGKSSEGEKTQHQKGSGALDGGNASRNFQKTTEKCFCGLTFTEKRRKHIQHIKENHIAA